MMRSTYHASVRLPTPGKLTIRFAPGQGEDACRRSKQPMCVSKGLSDWRS